MRILTLAFLACVLSAPTFAQVPKPPPVPVPAPKPAIRLPDLIQEAPRPVPVDVIQLKDEQLYVVDSDVPLILITSPEGVIDIEEDAGPIRIKALFVDAKVPGRSESRVFKGAHVYSLTAGGIGPCELLIIPIGVKTEADVIRRTFDVSIGPVPPVPPPVPPGPDPRPPIPPGPEPKPPTPVVTGKIWASYVIDTATVTAPQAAMRTSVTLISALKSLDTTWRTYESDDPQLATLHLDTAAANKYPAVILQGPDGKLLSVLPSPSETAVTAAVKTLRGAK